MKGERNIINIKLIGANSRNGIKMQKVIERAIEDSDLDINLIFLDDEVSKNKYNVKNFPGIIVEEKRFVKEKY